MSGGRHRFGAVPAAGLAVLLLAFVSVLAAVPASRAVAQGATAAGIAPAQPAEDIRDIRGPKYVANPWLIPALVGAAVLGGLGVYGLWRWQRRPRRQRMLLPFELALQRLAAIRAFMQPASAREFTTAASDIIRSYIERRFDVTATHRTTEEFLHDLLTSSHSSLARHRSLLEAFLNQCDLVKFAGVSLSPADMQTLHDSACRFVTETAAPDPAATAAAITAGPAVAAATPARPAAPRGT